VAAAKRATAKKGSRVRARSPRHSRLLLAGAIVLSAAIIGAWFPFGALLDQRSTLKGDQSELTALRSQDSALSQEQKNLSQSGEIDRIARQQYQLVSPGQQIYEVLPPPGSTTGGSASQGAAGAPVAPSAAAELPPGGVTTTTVAHSVHKAETQTRSNGLVSRMLHALEFWR
jgi:cell division protein FtsB